MPYIKQSQRDDLDPAIRQVVVALAQAEENELKGELNYTIYSIISHLIKGKGERYFRYNDMIGTLECCKLELYRHMIGPYEDKAIEKNGDV